MSSVNDIKTTSQRRKSGDTVYDDLVSAISYAADLRAYAEQRDKLLADSVERQAYDALALERDRYRALAEQRDKRVALLEDALLNIRDYRTDMDATIQARSMRFYAEMALSDVPTQVSQPVGAVVAGDLAKAAKIVLNSYDALKGDKTDAPEFAILRAALAAQTAAPGTDGLLPCPFCGGTPILEDHRLVWAVKCDCTACVIGDRAPEPDSEMDSAYWAAFKQSAVDKWNRRTETRSDSTGVTHIGYIPQRVVDGLTGTIAGWGINSDIYRNPIYDSVPIYTATLIAQTAAPAAPLDISGLTRYEGAEIAKIYSMEFEQFYICDDVQALIDAQKGGA